MIDFKVERAIDTVTIDTKDHASGQTGAIVVVGMSGKPKTTCLSKALSVHAVKEEFKGCINECDLLLITSVAADIATMRPFSIDGTDNRYFNIPFTQVIGVFQDGLVSLSSLSLLFDKLLVRKVQPKYGSLYSSVNDETMIGEVIKTGTVRFDKDWNAQPLKVQVGNTVLVRDNVSTEIMIENETYYAVEESSVVCIFNNKDNLSLEDTEFINDSVLMSPYSDDKLFGSSNIFSPTVDENGADEFSMWNRDLFKVNFVDSNLTKISKGDIVLLNRDIAHYVYFNSMKYFLVNGMTELEAKIN